MTAKILNKTPTFINLKEIWQHKKKESTTSASRFSTISLSIPKTCVVISNN